MSENNIVLMFTYVFIGPILGNIKKKGIKPTYPATHPIPPNS